MLNTQIRAFWGDELVAIPTEHLAKFKLSFEASQFLMSVGLPSKVGKLSSLIKEYLNMDFQGSPTKKITEVCFQQATYISIAHARRGEAIITCLEETSNAIVSLDTSEAASVPVCFVNSGLAQFFGFLQIYLEDYLLVIEELSTDEAMRIGLNMRQKFKLLDSEALDSEANFWPTRLWEIEIGML